jgi:hypothetical protein
VFENRVLRRIFGPKRDEVTREWRKLHNEELCTHHKISLADQIKKNEVGGTCGTHGRREKCKRWESPKERDHSEDRGLNGSLGSEWILGRLGGRVLIEFSWLMVGTGGGLL